MSQNVPGQVDKKDIAALDTLRSRLMPLTYNMELLKHDIIRNPNSPPNWPHIQRSISSLSSTLSSLQNLLDGDSDTAETLRSLHPYPISPFPIDNPAMAGLASTILRKRPDIHEEKWILDCLAKAQGFAHVPEDWNIEPTKPSKDDEDAVMSDDEDEGAAAKLKRQKGNLNEDQISDLWANCSDVTSRVRLNVLAALQMQSGSSESPEDMDMDGSDGDEQAIDDAENGAKSVAAPPMMSLAVLHKFMTTGAVDQATGKIVS